MDYPSLDEFFKSVKHHLKKGPIALIFAEDEFELVSTISHHINLGFTKTILFAKSKPVLPIDAKEKLVFVFHDLFNSPEVDIIINKINTLDVN